MFEALKNKRRDAMKVGTAWFLFGAIILVFIFWGMNPRHEGFGQGGIAAYVNNVGVPMRQVYRLVEQMRTSEPSSGEADQEGARRKQRQSMAIQQLVTQELVAQAADRAGLTVSDAEVRDFLTKQPAFQENGRFQREYYVRHLQNSGSTASELETTIRRDLLMQKIQRAFGSALRPTELELAKQKELMEAKTNLEFLAISTQAGDASTVSGSDAIAFEKANALKVKAYFDGHQSEFAKVEEAHARHILAKFEAGKADSEKNALTKITAIRARLIAGKESFAAVAKAESEDPGSKDKGGDLGFFARGRMVPAFEKAAFELAPNKLSEPVRSDYGYHLIEMLEKHPAKTASFDDNAKELIARKLVAEERAGKTLEQLQSLVTKGDTAGVDALAKHANLKWEETGVFSVESSAIPKIGANDEIARAAFGLSAAKPLGANVFRQGPKAYVIRYKALAPKAVAAAAAQKKSTPGLPDFEKPEFMREIMASQKTRDAMNHWVRELQKTAHIDYAPQVAER